jgi:hypothetical protein
MWQHLFDDHFGAIILKGRAMKLAIGILVLTLSFVHTMSGFGGAAWAASGKIGRSADRLSCSFSLPANASPAARCAAIRRQCGGKFAANACGGKMLSAT